MALRTLPPFNVASMVVITESDDANSYVSTVSTHNQYTKVEELSSLELLPDPTVFDPAVPYGGAVSQATSLPGYTTTCTDSAGTVTTLNTSSTYTPKLTSGIVGFQILSAKRAVSRAGLCDGLTNDADRDETTLTLYDEFAEPNKPFPPDDNSNDWISGPFISPAGIFLYDRNRNMDMLIYSIPYLTGGDWDGAQRTLGLQANRDLLSPFWVRNGTFCNQPYSIGTSWFWASAGFPASYIQSDGVGVYLDSRNPTYPDVRYSHRPKNAYHSYIFSGWFRPASGIGRSGYQDNSSDLWYIHEGKAGTMPLMSLGRTVHGGLLAINSSHQTGNQVWGDFYTRTSLPSAVVISDTSLFPNNKDVIGTAIDSSDRQGTTIGYGTESSPYSAIWQYVPHIAITTASTTYGEEPAGVDCSNDSSVYFESPGYSKWTLGSGLGMVLGTCYTAEQWRTGLSQWGYKLKDTTICGFADLCFNWGHVLAGEVWEKDSNTAPIVNIDGTTPTTTTAGSYLIGGPHIDPLSAVPGSKPQDWSLAWAPSAGPTLRFYWGNKEVLTGKTKINAHQWYNFSVVWQVSGDDSSNVYHNLNTPKVWAGLYINGSLEDVFLDELPITFSSDIMNSMDNTGLLIGKHDGADYTIGVLKQEKTVHDNIIHIHSEIHPNVVAKIGDYVGITGSINDPWPEQIYEVTDAGIDWLTVTPLYNETYNNKYTPNSFPAGSTVYNYGNVVTTTQYKHSNAARAVGDPALGVEGTRRSVNFADLPSITPRGTRFGEQFYLTLLPGGSAGGMYPHTRAAGVTGTQWDPSDGYNILTNTGKLVRQLFNKSHGLLVGTNAFTPSTSAVFLSAGQSENQEGWVLQQPGGNNEPSGIESSIVSLDERFNRYGGYDYRQFGLEWEAEHFGMQSVSGNIWKDLGNYLGASSPGCVNNPQQIPSSLSGGSTTMRQDGIIPKFT